MHNGTTNEDEKESESCGWIFKSLYTNGGTKEKGKETEF